jgi:hypothetical protein
MQYLACDEIAGETEGDAMANIGSVQQTSHYRAKGPCPYCEGTQQHESWCVTTNLAVRYAYEIVLGSSLLTAGDVLILHSLGVVW